MHTHNHHYCGYTPDKCAKVAATAARVPLRDRGDDVQRCIRDCFNAAHFLIRFAPFGRELIRMQNIVGARNTTQFGWSL